MFLGSASGALPTIFSGADDDLGEQWEMIHLTEWLGSNNNDIAEVLRNGRTLYFEEGYDAMKDHDHTHPNTKRRVRVKFAVCQNRKRTERSGRLGFSFERHYCAAVAHLRCAALWPRALEHLYSVLHAPLTAFKTSGKCAHRVIVPTHPHTRRHTSASNAQAVALHFGKMEMAFSTPRRVALVT